MQPLLFALLSLLSCQCGHGQSRLDRRVRVRYVSFLIETLVSVPCDRFEKTFSASERKIWVPENTGQTDSLIKLAHEFKLAHWPNVDVRAVIEWQGNGTTIHYCFDGAGHFTDGKKVYTNKALFAFLKKHISF